MQGERKGKCTTARHDASERGEGSARQHGTHKGTQTKTILSGDHFLGERKEREKEGDTERVWGEGPARVEAARGVSGVGRSGVAEPNVLNARNSRPVSPDYTAPALLLHMTGQLQVRNGDIRSQHHDLQGLTTQRPQLQRSPATSHLLWHMPHILPRPPGTTSWRAAQIGHKSSTECPSPISQMRNRRLAQERYLSHMQEEVAWGTHNTLHVCQVSRQAGQEWVK
ncbi:hypothetical protein BC826DRAFT_973192 [Russula brevipes]|nr:hypothetical protein BC826DRAFT_973192 [Russula brevipes]